MILAGVARINQSSESTSVSIALKKKTGATRTPTPVKSKAQKPGAKLTPKPDVTATSAAATTPRSADAAVRYFEFSEGKSAKFREIQINDLEVTVRYGRIGSDGTSSTRSFPDSGGVALAAKPFLCATGYASAIRLVRGILIAVIDMAFSLDGPFVRLRPQETWLTLRI